MKHFVFVLTIISGGFANADVNPNQQLDVVCDSGSYSAHSVEFDHGIILLKEARDFKLVVTQVIRNENCTISVFSNPFE